MDIHELAANQIHELKMLEMVSAKDLGIGTGFSILRVPGGWVFVWVDSSCFVPIDYEPREKAIAAERKLFEKYNTDTENE